MKAYIGMDQWVVAVGFGGSVIVTGKDSAEEIERSVARAAVVGVILGVLVAVIVGVSAVLVGCG